MQYSTDWRENPNETKAEWGVRNAEWGSWNAESGGWLPRLSASSLSTITLTRTQSVQIRVLFQDCSVAISTGDWSLLTDNSRPRPIVPTQQSARHIARLQPAADNYFQP